MKAFLKVLLVALMCINFIPYTFPAILYQLNSLAVSVLLVLAVFKLIKFGATIFSVVVAGVIAFIFFPDIMGIFGVYLPNVLGLVREFVVNLVK